MTDATRQLLTDYRAWVQRIVNTRDAVRLAYGPSESGYQFADNVSSRRILRMLKDPANFRNAELPQPMRPRRPLLRLVNDEDRHFDLSPSEPWDLIEGYLRGC